jgi:hypothetical protein
MSLSPKIVEILVNNNIFKNYFGRQKQVKKNMFYINEFLGESVDLSTQIYLISTKAYS